MVRERVRVFMVSLPNQGEKTGTESRKRKPKAEACELRLAAFALPKGSGLATVRAKTCPKAGLSGAGGKTVAAPAAGIWGTSQKHCKIEKRLHVPAPGSGSTESNL